MRMLGQRQDDPILTIRMVSCPSVLQDISLGFETMVLVKYNPKVDLQPILPRHLVWVPSVHKSDMVASKKTRHGDMAAGFSEPW